MGASTYSHIVDQTFWYILGISAFLLLGITVAMIYFAIRYSHKRHKKAAQIEGSILLETLWTVIPTLLVLSMFWYGWTGFRQMRNMPEDSMKVKVIARMWSWLFEYEDGRQSAELVVPVNTAVSLDLTSLDVIHSFYVPAFRLKEDCVPGRTNKAWFEATRTGDFDLFCAEYCGDQHAYMLSKVRSVSGEDFASWQAERPDPAAQGDQLFALKGCVACHSTDGTKMIGPSFKGLFGKTEIVLRDGVEVEITVDEDYLRKSIWEPNAEIVKGFEPVMPPQQGMMSDEELEALVQLIKELQ